MKKLLIALLILITLSSTVFNPVSTKKVDAKEAVRYVDRNWDDEAKKVKQEEKICTNYSVLDKDSKVLDGWCVVNEDVKADHILWVKGTANIIICDGVELECDAIRVNEGETLNIYSQSGDSGKLKVDYRHFENASAIGGGGMATSVATDYVPNIFNKNIWVETIYFSDPSCGAINIYGGIVDVKVSNNIYTASGIGGGGSSFSETSYTNGQIYKLIHDGENGYENLGYYEYKKESEGGGFDIKNFIRPLQDVEDHKYTLDKVDLPYSESKKGDIAIYGGKVNAVGGQIGAIRGDNLTVYGGDIEASVPGDGVAIHSDDGEINIRGGHIVTKNSEKLYINGWGIIHGIGNDSYSSKKVKVYIDGGIVSTSSIGNYSVREDGWKSYEGSGCETILDWNENSKSQMSVTANSYNGSVTLNKEFRDKDGNVFEKGKVNNNSVIAGKELTPYGNDECRLNAPTDFSAYNFVDDNGTYKLKFKPADEDVDTYELSVDNEKNKVTTFSTKGLKVDEKGFYTVEVNASALEKYAKEIKQNSYHNRYYAPNLYWEIHDIYLKAIDEYKSSSESVQSHLSISKKQMSENGISQIYVYTDTDINQFSDSYSSTVDSWYEKYSGEQYKKYITKDAKTPASLTVKGNDGKLNNVSETGTIKVRGNSTAQANKKSYNISFDSKQQLMPGAKAGKKWCLLANAYDKSLMRNKLAMDLGKAIGGVAVPEEQYVDLYINGTYVGNYVLSEPADNGRSGVDYNEGSKDAPSKDIAFESDNHGRDSGEIYT